MKVEYIVPGVWTDDDEDQAPTVAPVRPSSFVPAVVEQPPAAPTMPAWLAERQPLAVDAVWTPVEGAQERTSAMDRAKALQVRLAPFLAAWLGVGVVFGVVTAMVAKQWPAGAMAGVLLLAALTAFTYYRLNGQDYAHSREGTERHRLDTAADLARQRMDHEHELRRLALEAYLESLARHERGKA